MNSIISQRLPTKWAEREKLREKGQFWTPDWVAKAMVNYVVAHSSLVFDPALGGGAFYTALKAMNQSRGTNVKFYGTDIDYQLVEQANKQWSSTGICRAELRDFIKEPPKGPFKAIVGNPPYIRHHRLSEEIKQLTKRISLETLGKTLDGRAGIHVYFLIQALRLLEHNGKLAFIMPSDTCEGVFASRLWYWITNNYCLECVVTFSPQATPFPDVDTNPIIFLIRKTRPKSNILWVKVTRQQTEDLNDFVLSNFRERNFPSLRIVERRLDEALDTGLSREPQDDVASRYTLSLFATVVRGIATGANDFFMLTNDQARKLGIPPEFLIPAIGRTRDIDGSYITNEMLKKLEAKGRPTLLFTPDGRRLEDFPSRVQEYLKRGEEMGLPAKPLISSRKPWYKMERRAAPPFLFAYLGRRNARFIRNVAAVVPLTGFLCVYPHYNNPEYIESLWNILQHPNTLKNLSLVGKSYGSGAIKIEPRALERLPIPETLVQLFNQYFIHPHQIPLFRVSEGRLEYNPRSSEY